MKKTNLYLKQVRMVIETLSVGWRDELKMVQGAYETAHVARDDAADDEQSACKELRHHEQLLAVTGCIKERAIRAQLRARNLTLFANDSQTSAAQTQADMAAAAAAVKQAAGAMEGLEQAECGLAALLKSNDAYDSLRATADAATKAVKLSVASMDELQTQALEASIRAATPLAGSVAQIFLVLGEQIENLVTKSTQAHEAARQEVAESAEQCTEAWGRFDEASLLCERELWRQNGLGHCLAQMELPAKGAATLLKEPVIYDDTAKPLIDTLKQQCREAWHAKNTAQSAVDAWQKRRANLNALLTRTQSGATKAEEHFDAAQITTQTLINDHGHAAEAQQRAEKIRHEMRTLCKLACSAAMHAADATEAVEEMARSIARCTAQNELVAKEAADSGPRVLAAARATMTAALAALQLSSAALVSAEEAAPAATTVKHEAGEVLKLLLPQAVAEDASVTVTSVRHFKLVEQSLPDLHQVVHDLEETEARGLLYLADVVRKVREGTCTQVTKRHADVDLALNAAMHELEKATLLCTSSQTVMIAVEAT